LITKQVRHLEDREGNDGPLPILGRDILEHETLSAALGHVVAGLGPIVKPRFGLDCFLLGARAESENQGRQKHYER